jgi:hypothetical protein
MVYIARDKLDGKNADQLLTKARREQLQLSKKRVKQLAVRPQRAGSADRCTIQQKRTIRITSEKGRGHAKPKNLWAKVG